MLSPALRFALTAAGVGLAVYGVAGILAGHGRPAAAATVVAAALLWWGGTGRYPTWFRR